jgi:GNAT superfamily N-acetyltransferase
MIAVRALTGTALDAALDDVAALRIAVFRDWPYLYDGDLAYERHYLQTYRDSPGAVLVGAFEGSRLIGAATGTPMEDHPEFAAHLPMAAERTFYCAESVLLADWRGRGLGHRFFDLREDHARRLGRRHVVFCSVIRAADHPLRPKAARSNDDFWRKRGYAPLPGAVATFSWKDVDQPGETAKSLQFWARNLD